MSKICPAIGHKNVKKLSFKLDLFIKKQYCVVEIKSCRLRLCSIKAPLCNLVKLKYSVSLFIYLNRLFIL